MGPKINLLQGRHEAIQRERMAFAKVQFVVMVILVCYIAMLVLVIGVQTFLSLQHKRTLSAIQTEELALATLKPIEEKYVMVSNKLSLLNDYLNSKGKAREALGAIYQSLPDGLTLSGVTLDDDENTVAIQAVAQDMVTMLAYLDTVEQEVKEGQYPKILVSGIGRGENGMYSISSEYVIKE